LGACIVRVPYLPSVDPPFHWGQCYSYTEDKMKDNSEYEEDSPFAAMDKMTKQIMCAVLDIICPYDSASLKKDLRRVICPIVYELEWTSSDDVEDVIELVLADPRVMALPDRYADRLQAVAPAIKPTTSVPTTPQVKPQPKKPTRTAQPAHTAPAVDDNVLSAQILELIKRDRWMDYTYDQVADALGIRHQDASRIIRKLPSDTGVVKLDKLVNGKSTAVFKYVPERSIYRHPGNRSKLDIMCKFIGELLRHSSGLCQKEIIDTARFQLSGADEHLVRDALRMMVGVGMVTEEKGHRYRTHYRLNTDLDDSTKKKRKSALKVSPEFRKYYSRSG